MICKSPSDGVREYLKDVVCNLDTVRVPLTFSRADRKAFGPQSFLDGLHVQCERRRLVVGSHAPLFRVSLGSVFKRAAGEDQTPDLRIMRLTRCQLRYCRLRPAHFAFNNCALVFA